MIVKIINIYDVKRDGKQGEWDELLVDKIKNDDAVITLMAASQFTGASFWRMTAISSKILI